MSRKKTAEELDREIAEALARMDTPATQPSPRSRVVAIRQVYDPDLLGAAAVDLLDNVDADHPSDDSFDRAWKQLARQGSTDSFGGAAYRRVKEEWRAAGRQPLMPKALEAFILRRA